MEYTYFLVRICPDSHKYLRRVCQFRVLPFDLSTVPTGVPNTRTGGLQTTCRQVGTGSSTGHSGSRSRTSSGYPSNIACSSSSVHLHGATHLGLMSRPIGSSAPETATRIFQLYGPGQLVCTGVSHTSRSYTYCFDNGWTSLLESLSLSGLPKQGQPSLRMPPPRRGHPYRGFSDLGIWLCGLQAPYQLSGAQGGVLGSVYLGSSAPGPPGMVATDNTTVVYYINKQSGTWSFSLLRYFHRSSQQGA